MDLAQELRKGDLAILKTQLGQLQMVGRFGYSRDCEMFVDIMKGLRILQNMAEYLMEKIMNMEKKSKETNENNYGDTSLNDLNDDDENLLNSGCENDDSEIKEESMDKEPIVEIRVEPEPVEQIQDSRNHKATFQCEKCSRTFVNLKSFGDHECYKKKEKVPCKVCGKEVSRANISKHTKIHSTAIVICNICDKSFKNKLAFENHQHRQLAKRDCDICNRSFKKPSSLRYHEIRTHGDKAKESFALLCRYCQIECPSKSAVRKHMVSEHGDKAMYCDICNNQFFSKKGLRLHKQDHGIEKV